jgi:hypothetical protein
MNNLKYESILNDSKYLKIKDREGQFFYNEKNDLVISFLYRYFIENNSRVCFTICLKDNLNEDVNFKDLRTKNIDNQSLFFVNYENEELAMTFSFHIDPENRTAEIKLHDKPKLEILDLTYEEKFGVQQYF